MVWGWDGSSSGDVTRLMTTSSSVGDGGLKIGMAEQVNGDTVYGGGVDSCCIDCGRGGHGC